MTQRTLTFTDPSRRTTLCDRVLAVMADGRWYSALSLEQRVNEQLRNEGVALASGSCVTARIRELRGKGHIVDCRRVDGVYRYRLVS